MTLSVAVDLGGLTHAGRVRANNEDHFVVARVDRSVTTLISSLPEGCGPVDHALVGYAMAVADGMGGAAAGEVASATALTAFAGLVHEAPSWIMRPSGEGIGEITRRAAERFKRVSAEIRDLARANPELAGMGTTMTFCVSLGAELMVAHVGDSRAYLLRGGVLRQLTRDDTITQALVDSGSLTPEEAEKHPFRNVLTEVLGGRSREIDPELRNLTLRDDDRLLLCSDGLTDMVSPEAIAATLGRDCPASETCASLVDQALEAGGRDNVTAVVARYRFTGTPEG